MKLWLCALETSRWNSRGSEMSASVASVSRKRGKCSLNKISAQGEGKQLFRGEVGLLAEHRRLLFEPAPSKTFARVRTEMALLSGELIRKQR